MSEPESPFDKYQRTAKTLRFVIEWLILIGTIVQTLLAFQQVVTPFWTVTGLVVVGGVWFGLWLYLKKKPITWVSKDGQKVNWQLGRQQHLMFTVAIIALLIPRALDLIPKPPPPDSELYYVIVIDASDRVLKSAPGQPQKWQHIQEAAIDQIRFGTPNAHYGLIVIGGGQTGATLDCNSPQLLSSSLETTKENAKTYIEQLQPTGGGSLTQAMSVANSELRKLTSTVNKNIIVFSGGGDQCDPTMWDDFKRFVQTELGDQKVYTELVLLADETEGIPEEVISTVNTIGTASVAKNPDELTKIVDDLIKRILERAEEIAPTVVAEQKTVNANTAVIERSKTPVPTTTPTVMIILTPTSIAQIQPVPPTSASSPLTVNPTETPVPPPLNFSPTASRPPNTPIPPTLTSTPSSTPTQIPTTPPPPPPPTLTPSLTATSTPPPPTNWPYTVTIIGPNDGQNLGCGTGTECQRDVVVQWVPDTETQGRTLSVWIRPLPGQGGQQYWRQSGPQYIGNGQWRSGAFFGIASDPSNTPYQVHALVTDTDPGGNADQLPASYISAPSINVTR